VSLLSNFNQDLNVTTNFGSSLQTTRNGVYEEITSKLNSAQKILSFRLRSVNIKINIYETKTLSVVLYVGWNYNYNRGFSCLLNEYTFCSESFHSITVTCFNTFHTESMCVSGYCAYVGVLAIIPHKPTPAVTHSYRASIPNKYPTGTWSCLKALIIECSIHWEVLQN
jgi:hypothetical protein